MKYSLINKKDNQLLLLATEIYVTIGNDLPSYFCVSLCNVNTQHYFHFFMSKPHTDFTETVIVHSLCLSHPQVIF